MKGVICAGGLGTRLYPLTRATNKHLLPVYDQPMICYPIQTLVNAGIKEIIIVTGGPHAGDFIRVLQDGREFGIRQIFYAYQVEEGGISQAIACAEKYANGEKIAVILGDNCTNADISSDLRSFKGGAKIFLKKVPDPRRFGVPVFKAGKIIKIEEKPEKPKSNYAVTGLYLYDQTVFRRIRKLKPSKRGELEVTDLNNNYLDDGLLDYCYLKGWWRDAGTFDTLFEVGQFWAKKRSRRR